MIDQEDDQLEYYHQMMEDDHWKELVKQQIEIDKEKEKNNDC